MATISNSTTASRFHNLSNEALADRLGDVDARLKAIEAEAKAIKDELKARGVAEVQGERFTITVTEQIAGRADVAALKAHLGDAYCKFEKVVISTVVRIKAANRLAIAA